MNAVVDMAPFQIARAKNNYELIGGASVPAAQIEYQGDVILKSVLQRTGLYEERRMLFHNWPNLETVANKYCQLLSPQYPGKNGPLLDEVLTNAFAAFYASSAAKEPEITQMVRFLEVLSNSADRIQGVCAFALSARGDPIPWQHFSEPLGAWLRRISAKEVCFSVAGDLSTDAVIGGRIVLNTKIMSISDIGKLALLSKMGLA